MLLERCSSCQRKRTEENKNEFHYARLTELLPTIPADQDSEYYYCKAGYGCFNFLPKKAS